MLVCSSVKLIVPQTIYARGQRHFCVHDKLMLDHPYAACNVQYCLLGRAKMYQSLDIHGFSVMIGAADCEVVRTATAINPGATCGPLQVDFRSLYGTLTEYSIAEARNAFHRTLSAHQRHGW